MYSSSIYGYAARRVGRQRAGEVVSDVFAVAWRRRGDLPEHPLPWLYGVARKVIGQQLRTDVRQSELRSALEQVRLEARSEWADRVAAAFSRLDDADQEVLRLVAWEQLRPSEAAQVLGTSPTAFRMRLSRARRRLRQAVDTQEMVDRGI